MTENSNNNKKNIRTSLKADDSDYETKLQDRIALINENKFMTEAEVEEQKTEMERIQDSEKKLMAAVKMFKGKRNWNYSVAGNMSKAIISKHLNSMKSGLYSTFPILCNGIACPYADQCFALRANLQPPQGEPCVIETDKIERLLDGYNSQFDFMNCTLTDFLAINELIQIDILLDRCTRLMAKEISPIIDVNIGVANTGDVITQPMVSKSLEAYEKLSKRRSQLLEELLGTRKANKDKQGSGELDPITDMLERASSPDFNNVEQRPDKFKEG